MTSILSAILCWVKQIGAMVLSAGVELVNLVLAALVGAANALIEAWPIAMPALPTAPSQLGTAFAWVKWSPLPVEAGFAFLLFSITVWVAWMLAAPILRWAKAID